MAAAPSSSPEPAPAPETAPEAPLSHPNVEAAFVAFAADVVTIPQDKVAVVETRSGGSYTYRYADLADVLASVRPLLARHGLALTQDVRTVDRSVEVTTFVLHVSGGSLAFGPLALPLGDTPQGTGSAITYARRYAVLAALGLATEEDDDGRAAAPRSNGTAAPAPARRGTAKRATGSGSRGEDGSNLAPGVGNLINALNGINPPAARASAMRDFLATFGTPSSLAPERVAEAAEWVAERIDAPTEGDGGGY